MTRPPDLAYSIVFELWDAGHLNHDHEPHDPGYPAAVEVVRSALAGGAVGEREEPLDVERLRQVVTYLGEVRPWLFDRAKGTPNEGLVLADEIAEEYAARLSVNEGGVAPVARTEAEDR